MIVTGGRSQDDLMSLLGDDQPQREFAYAAFKSSHLILGQSIEMPSPGDMNFWVSHHFGHINSGFENFYGLDQAFIRFGFEYTPIDRLCLGIGRSTYEETFDGYLKFKILRQSKGAVVMPVTLAFFSSVALNSSKWADPDRKNYFTSRLSYTFQLLLARKFNDYISLQLMPTMVHRNLVPTKADKNDVFLIGAGGRCKITKRLSFNLEYYYLLPDQVVNPPAAVHSSFSAGLDIETGGHVFQLFFTNSSGLQEHAFLTNTTGDWFMGDIYFGFNLMRVFTIKMPKIPTD
ncbi:MAG: hypothetical protein FJY10_07145 [Bacteroidetes bacterium]|nr:hypothetical protein [Bacteroidota bacterium]